MNAVAQRSGEPPFPAARPVLGSSARLVDALSRFTAERRRDDFDLALLKTMVELLPVRRATLFRKDGEMIEASSPGTPCHCGGPEILTIAGSAFEMIERIDGTAEKTLRAVYEAQHSLHPLSDHLSLVGVIALENLPGAHADLAMVNGLICIYRNFVRVIDDAHRDTLTGLLNRKTFEDNIRRILDRGIVESDPAPGVERRKPTSTSQNFLAVLDIDHFKRVNDQFGHLYGDEVLLLFAQLMRKCFRKHDQLFRFGGEEFAVVLQDCDVAGAWSGLERFRELVATYPFPQVGTITVSSGFVAISGQDVPASVVGHADAALYHSKNHGRNRVTQYETLRAAESDASSVASGSVDLF